MGIVLYSLSRRCILRFIANALDMSAAMSVHGEPESG